MYCRKYRRNSVVDIMINKGYKVVGISMRIDKTRVITGEVFIIPLTVLEVK